MENKIKISGIYCFENLIDEKKYVGQAQDIFDRKMAHIYLLRSEKCKDSKYFRNAWKKYGSDNFKFWIVEECMTELLNEREIYWIKELHSHFTENGYNLSWGGEAFMRGLKQSDEAKQKISDNHVGMLGKKHSKESKQKLSRSHMGHVPTEETREKLRKATGGKNNPNFGKHPSEETRQKMIDNHKGMLGKHHTEETKQKQSDVWTNEKRLKQSEARSGENNPMWHKTISEEAREKQSKAMTGRIASEKTREKMSNAQKIRWENKKNKAKHNVIS